VDLTSDDVQDILLLLDGLPFGELHLQTTRFTLSLRRTANGEWTQATQVLAPPNVLPAAPADAGPAAPPPAEAAPPVPGAPSPAEAGPATPSPAEASPAGPPPAPPAPGGLPADELADVRAHLLGTFYRAPRPGASPFVDVGSRVEPDTVVGIIETMKLMNSVAAGVRGTVAEILLANAQFAEQGVVLMRISEDR
jgi:acetyl-CoA carboxylase biotin carboxyl carrier protein